ncbi:hypothetical protein [Solimonas sp. SE-A11]|uniref:hypothetical protein n=1 Tax=Solimonas sp. SE-A11 TaxID=3054954 RepID=UPI00259D0D3B|nr:hypothetical protein [Solimonas sp. SE-A11]MDM4769062.1 hypothetical protein [Solimonas sp. SE-A11]
MTSNYLVVTNCTARKRVGVDCIPFSPAKNATAEVMARKWRQTLCDQPASQAAEDLYVGRSIKEARTVAQQLNAPLHIVSAGLGLIEGTQKVPGYDLSAADKGSPFDAWLTQSSVTTHQWWKALTAGYGLGWLLQNAPKAIVLVALPNDYLDLIGAELSGLTPGQAGRLRIFTSAAGRRASARFSNVPFMPYDDRLEAQRGWSGTRADFPQRALRHFVERLGAHARPVPDAVRAVAASMASHKAPEVPKRERLTDEEICALIRAGWNECDGNSARLLRYLRDDRGAACEQGRFAELRKKVLAEWPTATVKPRKAK